jgi:hypothetical protein
MNHECMMNLHTVYDESSNMLHRGSFVLTRELGEVKHLKPRRERDLVISKRVWCLIHVDLLLRFQSKFIRKRLCYLISQVQLCSIGRLVADGFVEAIPQRTLVVELAICQWSCCRIMLYTWLFNCRTRRHLRLHSRLFH